MRDATGKPADGFHLARLAELVFQPAALGHVARDRFEPDDTSVADHQTPTQFNRNPPLPTADDRQLDELPLHFRPAGQALQLLNDSCVLRRHHLRQTHRQGLFSRVAHHELRGAVDRAESSVEIDGEHHVVGVLEQFAIPLFAGAEGLFRPAPFAPDVGFTQLPLDDGKEAGEVVFVEIVVGSRAHQLDGQVLTDVTRDDDEWNVETGGLEHLQRVESTEARQAMFRDHEVPGSMRERFAHGIRSPDADHRGVEASSVQLTGHEFVEHVRFIDDERSKARGHAGASRGSQTDTVTPDPGRASTAIAPPWPRTMPSAAGRPRPRPVSRVVKNGSNIRAWTAGVIPLP